jgi:hypothetical protein
MVGGDDNDLDQFLGRRIGVEAEIVECADGLYLIRAF